MSVNRDSSEGATKSKSEAKLTHSVSGILRVALLTASMFAGSAAIAANAGKIAVVQYNPDANFGDPKVNTRKLTSFANEAIRDGADIVVFPEGSTFGYATDRELWCKPGMKRFKVGDGEYRHCRDVSKVSESLADGPTVQYWRNFARQHHKFIVFSIIERTGSVFYNTLVAASPEGELVPYRKRTLDIVDKAYATPGRESAILETPFGRFGFLICVDSLDTDESTEEDLNWGYYREYKRRRVNAMIIALNWGEDDPNSPWSAKAILENRSKKNSLDIFAADAKDGTGAYSSRGGKRQRTGLSDQVGTQGISYHLIHY